MSLKKKQTAIFFSILISCTPLICNGTNSTTPTSTANIDIWPFAFQGNMTRTSLQQAIDYSYVNLAPHITSVNFLIHEGLYVNQVGILKPKQGTHYEFTSIANEQHIPVFDGFKRPLTWLKIISAHGPGSSVTLNKLKIINYSTAISIEGDRENLNSMNANNKITQMHFENIGQTSLSSPPSTAAIRLINSHNNEITFNHFNNIKNIHNCNLLHSIYLAHNSSNNLIQYNTFTDFCGSAIRIRDNSNRNTVTLNSFNHAKKSQLMDQWFCDKALRADCTKKHSELPSESNVFINNKVSP